MITSANRVPLRNTNPAYRFIQQGPEIHVHRSEQTPKESVQIKSLWPDIEDMLPNSSGGDLIDKILKSNYFHRMTSKQVFSAGCIPGVITNEGFDIRHDARILDIGALQNTFNNTLMSIGFSNTLGIDIRDEILRSPQARRVNFRDLELSEIFNVIHFANILDYMGGGVLNFLTIPTLDLFSSKLYAHLSNNGYLIFEDCNRRVTETFFNVLHDHGLYEAIEPVFDIHFWRKS